MFDEVHLLEESGQNKRSFEHKTRTNLDVGRDGFAVDESVLRILRRVDAEEEEEWEREMWAIYLFLFGGLLRFDGFTQRDHFISEMGVLVFQISNDFLIFQIFTDLRLIIYSKRTFFELATSLRSITFENVCPGVIQIRVVPRGRTARLSQTFQFVLEQQRMSIGSTIFSQRALTSFSSRLRRLSASNMSDLISAACFCMINSSHCFFNDAHWKQARWERRWSNSDVLLRSGLVCGIPNHRSVLVHVSIQRWDRTFLH